MHGAVPAQPRGDLLRDDRARLQRWTPRQTEYRAKVVGERYDGPIYQRSSTSSEQIELAADAYRTGAEVPLDRFAPATAIIDP